MGNPEIREIAGVGRFKKIGKDWVLDDGSLASDRVSQHRRFLGPRTGKFVLNVIAAATAGLIVASAASTGVQTVASSAWSSLTGAEFPSPGSIFVGEVKNFVNEAIDLLPGGSNGR